MNKSIISLLLTCAFASSAFAGATTTADPFGGPQQAKTANQASSGEDARPEVKQDQKSSILKTASAKQQDPGTQKEVKPGQQLKMPPLPAITLNTMSPEQRKEESFNATLDQEIPMTPDQIRRLRTFLDEQQRAKSELPYTPPKAESRTVVIRGEPGETPAVIRLSRNFVTTMVFSDATGAPWPVKSFGTGNDNMINAVAPDPDNAPNVITVSTSSSYVFGNMQVILAGRTTPVMLTVTSDQKAVDYVANMKVQARGPNAAAPVMSSENYSMQINPKMTSVLDGVMPSAATQMKSSDPRLEVWKMDNQYYVRTKMTMYSPGWSNHISSPDGMHAYEILPTPVVVAADNGNPQQISIGE